MKDILIVEDGRQERDRLHQLFALNGYSVVACDSVALAEEKAKSESFRLAILDIGLNDRSGSYLFHSLKSQGKANLIIIFTGNPSVHLKHRFIEEGASDYIVKGSSQARNEDMLARVQELIGSPVVIQTGRIPLEQFLENWISSESKKLFLDSDDQLPACPKCKSRSYGVDFSHRTQLPPDVIGQVICLNCGCRLDPEVS